ncbi:MAG: hypothetical protein GY827_12310 [Cytophagales bacterium]|nr:hypothetical protein [Cytophagales bacterium]
MMIMNLEEKFSDGTILTKTFFYFKDERDTSLGKQIIETRLLIKKSGIWNVATYQWNESQTDATLELNGLNTQFSWIDANGKTLSTLYHVPTQNECMACHQSNSTMSPLGPTATNLNREVVRNGIEVNQITHMQSMGILDNFPVDQVHQMVNYKDKNASLAERGRAYLAMNCAHCHNPKGWDTPAQEGFDFRYDTPFDQTGIQDDQNEIRNNVVNGQMPFIGTTMLDEEGVALLVEYLDGI